MSEAERATGRGLIRRLRLRHKLGMSLIIAALLPVLVASWVAVSVVLRGLNRGLMEETERQLQVGLNLFLRNVERLGHEAVRLSSSGELVRALRAGPVAITDALAAESPYLSSSLVQVANADGVIQAQRVVGGLVGRFENLGVTDASPSVAAGMKYERRITIVPLGDRLVVRAVAPVVDASFKLRGVVVLSVPLDGAFADSVKAAMGSDVLIYGGTAPTSSAMSTFFDHRGARAAQLNLPADVAEKVGQGQTSFRNAQILEGEFAVGYAPIIDLSGEIVGAFSVAVDRASLLSARTAATRSLALGAAGAFVFALGLAGLISRRLVRPLQRLHQGVKAIARGDLDHQIDVDAGDEIGDVATAFAHMTRALKENQRRLAARMREIVALHDASRSVSSVIELDQVLRKIVDSVARVLYVRVCALWLVKEGRKADGKPILKLGAGRAKGVDLRTIIDESQINELVQPLEKIALEVAEKRVNLRIDDVSRDDRRCDAATAAGITGSLVATALERKGAVVGVVIIGRGEGARPFSEADADLLATFADQAATTIENASLYAEVRGLNEELEAKVKIRTMELTAMNAELGRTITELRETQAQLILSERLAGLGQLVAGVAHEINSPSAAIRGTADALTESIARLTALSQRIVGLDLSLDDRTRMVALVSELGPVLARRARPAPVVVRRTAREIAAQLPAVGLEGEAAAETSRSVAELGGAPGDLEHLGPLLAHVARSAGDAAAATDRARLVCDYLAEHVYLHRGAATIRDAVHRIQRLVGSLKSYSHLDQDASRVLVDIHEGLDTTLAILDHMLSRGITVTRHYGDLPVIPVYVDELNQVWTNLIHNAVQALGGTDNAEIVVETRVEDDGVTVDVIDNGPGIPEDVMPQVFDPFFTTKPTGEGTGLGLGIARQIVDKHGGRVACDSRPGRTCFSVWLPAEVETEAEAEGDGGGDEAAGAEPFGPTETLRGIGSSADQPSAADASHGSEIEGAD